ncbi:MAG: MFS transporter [Desulfobacterales bacterium SG8_35]|nr:MAG: MFS transporter [Desulfobacterales bacterium SG8_35]
MAVGRYQSYKTLFTANRRFRRFWLAGVISHLGNWFNYIGIFVLLTKLTGSGGAVSWFLIAKFIPTTFLGPAAGVIADRYSRKTIMITSDLLRVFIVLAFLLVRKPEHVWLVYILALVQESIWTFYDPARKASVPNLCSPEELILANALSGATWSIMLAFGAALGGFVTHLYGWETAIVIDAATFLVSAIMLAGLDLPHTPPEKKEKPSWHDLTGITDLREGLKYVFHHKEVATLLLVKSGWALSGGILVLLTVFGEQVFSTGGQGGKSGVLYSVRGLGAAIGPILAWHYFGETRKDMYRSISFSFFIASGAYILFSRAPTLLWAVPFVLLGHIGGSIQWVFSTTLLQQIVPDQFRGRVFAAEMALLTLILSLSTYFTGLGLDHGVDPRLLTLRLALIFLVPGTFWVIYLRLNKTKLGKA